MKILVCDDDKNILEQISKLINNRSQFQNTQFEIDIKTSGDFILKEKISFDVAFIDIELKGISGLKLARKLKEINPDVVVIIITSFPEYLDDAMKINVFRYISKPINQNRFYNALYDAFRSYHDISKTIVIDFKSEVFTVRTKNILYIETSKNGSTIVTKEDEYRTNKTLNEWLTIIDQPSCFVYSHNSYVVNLQNVIGFNSLEVRIRKNENEIVKTYMSQRKYSSFKKSFISYAGGNI